MGQNFERCTIGHFQTLSTSITLVRPQILRNHFFGVVVKSTNRAFRKHILYIPLLIFVHHTGSKCKKMTKSDVFTLFHFFGTSCKFSSYITDII